ncbi:MAG: deoxyribose-phosphate aldolase [Candidatus Korarchaeota archaeon]|nr:deoxyribose-phosphate aldolase [Candidatus Korarchaeota archaeon]
MIRRSELVKMIDHTLLKPQATESDVAGLVEEGLKYGFHSVVVNPYYVPLAARLARGSSLKVCSVVGFPLGATLPEVKAREAELVGRQGASEVDMVINVGALRSGLDDIVLEDVRGVVRAFRGVVPGGVVKVILETGLLKREEIEAACALVEEAGADFVKTSTGFGPRGATVEDVRLLRNLVGDRLGVKAAGGIRTYEQAVAMIEAGANRIGTSSGVKIAEGAPE